MTRGVYRATSCSVLIERGATLRQPRLGAEHLHPLFGVPQVCFGLGHGGFGLLHLGDEGALVEQIQALPGFDDLSTVEQLLLDEPVHPGTNLHRLQGVRGAGVFRVEGQGLGADLNDADGDRRGTGRRQVWSGTCTTGGTEHQSRYSRPQANTQG